MSSNDNGGSRRSTMDKGKFAEKEVQKVFTVWTFKHFDFNAMRFPDAHAARGVLAAMPSDFLVVYRGVTTFIEVKSTEQATRLPKAKISQYGYLKSFHLAGAKVLVIVHQHLLSRWVMLTGDDLFCYEDCPASFPLTNLPQYDTAAEALEEYFK